MALNNAYYNDALRSRTTLDGQKAGAATEPAEPNSQQTSSNPTSEPQPYENNFLSCNTTMTMARKQYLKMLTGGIVVTSLVIFTIFAIFWGAFYRTPVRNLPGWIVVRMSVHHL